MRPRRISLDGLIRRLRISVFRIYKCMYEKLPRALIFRYARNYTRKLRYGRRRRTRYRLRSDSIEFLIILHSTASKG